MVDVCGLVPEMSNESPHVWPNPILSQECSGEIDKHPIKQGLFDVHMQLSQLCLDHSRARLPLVSAAMEAVMKINGLESVIHHPLNDFPDWFDQTYSTISASTL